MMQEYFYRRVISSSPFSQEYKNIIPHSLRSLTERIDEEQQLHALTASDSFSEEVWRNIQFLKLKRILAHAENSVPYWHSVFKKNDFKPRHITGINEIERLPILKRQDIKAGSLEQMVSNDVSSDRFVEAATSGTTGDPLRFYYDTSDLFRRRINTLQELRYGGVSEKSGICVLGLFAHKYLEALGAKFWDVRDLNNNRTRINTLYPYLNDKNPGVLITTPSMLKEFFYFLKKDAKDVTFRAIFCLAEHLEEAEKADAEAFFRCPVFSVYGSKECSLIGVQCEHKSMHLAPWMNLVEIVSDTGINVPDGVEGNIVVTAFENKVMPFIRYQTGDRGRIVGRDCACGRNTALLEFTGRRSLYLRSQQGRDVPLLEPIAYITRHFYKNIVHFQFVQSAPGVVSFRFVVGEPDQDLERKLQKYFSDFFGNPFLFQLEKVSSIAMTEDGKVPLLVHT